MRNGNSAKMGLFTLLALTIASPALAAPTAVVVTTPIQDATAQVAPCAYHFDATGSSATGYTRPFHTLRYEWDFGDSNAGSWDRGASSRDNTASWDRNHDIGAIAGHVYEQPGDYEVTLTVTDPAGVSHQSTSNVTCRDPATHFSPALTHCFADISGNGGNWNGCPANASRHDTTDFDVAVNQTCGAAGNPGRHCTFRRGDSFVQSSTIQMRSTGTVPGLIDTFGSGSKPVVRIAGSMRGMTLGDKWTLSGFDFRGDPSCLDAQVCEFAVGTWAAGATLHNVDVDNVLRCYGQGIHAPDRLAIVDFDCTLNNNSGGSAPNAVYLSGPNIVFMGNNIDENYIPGGGFAFRYSASTDAGATSDKTVVAHSRFQRMPSQYNPLQIRGEHRYLQIHDNHISTRDARELIEVCERPGGCHNPDSNARDFMFEMNFNTIESGATNGQIGLLSFMASDWTARNNIIDLQGVAIVGGQLAICDHVAGFGVNVNGSCLNNTVYTDDSSTGGIVVFRGCGTGSGNVAKGNLLFTPNLQGGQTIASGGGCETEANLYVSSNPFAATPPDQGQTGPSDFMLRSNSSAIGAGPDYSDETDHFVAIDAFRGCRTDAGAGPWDIGAHQFGADSCGAGPIVSNPPPAAPVLLD